MGLWGSKNAQGVERSATVGAPGLVNFVTDIAYHFYPSLPAAFTQPCASIFADLCHWVIWKGCFEAGSQNGKRTSYVIGLLLHHNLE